MSLQSSEVVVGAVAYLVAKKLIANDQIAITGPEVVLPDGTRGANPVPRDGPFVCVEITAENAKWVYVTNQFREERLRIEASWVENGYGPLAAGENYLQDGANTYSGPIEAFVDAAASEKPLTGGARPHITGEGIEAIRREVDRQRHRAVAYKR